MSNYLEIIAGCFGGKGDDNYKLDDDLAWAETPSEIQLTKKGIEVVDVGDDISDGIIHVFDDGELKATGYVSTRGAYQAGAYDGENEYFSTNMFDGEIPDPFWTERDDTICGQIAREGWEAYQEIT